ncbi:MAG: RNA methyltransferase [Candidatus Omnitrophica bacterium]|nr:RNA methyltransferase [Candidatus Omnitrophota bacterium]MDD4012877.1 RNA methyltransferase [Candidatus Omnitrophota bacterium]
MDIAPVPILREAQLLLKEKKERDRTKLFAAEGFKVIKDMTFRGHLPKYVVLADRTAKDPQKKELLDRFEASRVPVYVTSNKDFELLSEMKTSQGILAVIPKSEKAVDVVRSAGKSIAVLCDGIQDPGNFGAMIRTSAAFGADIVLRCGDTADKYNPKVIRGSSGTMLDIAVLDYNDELASCLKDAGYKLLAASAAGEQASDLRKIRIIPEKVIIAFGSEGRGISERVLAMADGHFHIPIDPVVESLNVTAAAAITLFTFTSMEQR